MNMAYMDKVHNTKVCSNNRNTYYIRTYNDGNNRRGGGSNRTF